MIGGGNSTQLLPGRLFLNPNLHHPPHNLAPHDNTSPFTSELSHSPASQPAPLRTGPGTRVCWGARK